MIYIALAMLLADRAKYAGLVFGITFTSFLVTFAASYFTGFMTRGFALISENGRADVWVMDPAVTAVDQTTNLPEWALGRVRSVPGVKSAVPLALGTAEARFPGVRFQPFQVIGVDDATLSGVPSVEGGVSPLALRGPDAVIVDAGGTTGKLDTAAPTFHRWAPGKPGAYVPTRELAPGDEFLLNDHRAVMVGRSHGIPRYPPRPLIFTTLSKAVTFLLPERRRVTFVLAAATPEISPSDLARRIEDATGLRARSADDFKADTVRWILVNSEDVGDIAAMITFAMSVGFGVTGVMLYMFTHENLRQYAVLSAMGATPRMLLCMVFAQAAFCALIGTGLGLGLCGIAGQIAATAGYPFRIMWFTPLFGVLMVLVVSVVAAAVSVRPVLRQQPMAVFAGR